MRILVIGDIMLDRYFWGEINRISPEVPVPVCKLRDVTYSLGGAANVAHNLVNLGVQATLVGVVGDDDTGDRMAELCREVGIEPRLVRDASRPTTMKTRVIGSSQHVVRIDEEVVERLDDALSAEFKDAVVNAASDCTGVILSDYAKGTLLDPELCQWLIQYCREIGKPVYVDPKSPDWRQYRGATCIKPNRKELREAARREGLAAEDITACAREMRKRFEIDYLLLTLGPEGMQLLSESTEEHFVSNVQEVFDVSGAGDTVISTFAASNCAGMGLEESAQRANAAAGVVVGKVGTYPITQRELEQALGTAGRRTSKLCSIDEALHRIALWRSEGSRVVFTNGCFDILHAGHVLLFHEARNLGDKLVVAMNSDESVKRLKGDPRPILSEKERVQILSAIEYVDMLLIFHEDEPVDLIERVRPDVLAKGSDYNLADVVGADVVASYGGEVKLVSILENSSVSEIMDRLKK